MKKIVKKWGDSLVIVFNSEDRIIHKIAEGSIVDLSDMTVLIDEHKLADLNISKICKEMKK